ncbi:hypothetical protein ABI59_13090 [Acidobacteria bacterium Mor1]|nr:hypothetical protein ABI59_13090 [Acidobacteria bacterium Mor1]
MVFGPRAAGHVLGLSLTLLAGLPLWASGESSDEAAAETARPSGVRESVRVEGETPETEDVAAFVTTLDARDLAAQGADLSDLLRQVPGARVRDYGGLGQYATVSLRGSTAEQVTVLVDGVPQNRALGGPVNLAAIPASDIAEVTVFRGFGPAHLGLGGLGGLIDIRTREPEAAEGRFDLLAGELGTTRVSGGAVVPAGEHGHLRFGVESLESEGDYRYLDTGATPFNSGDDVVRRRENNGLEHRSVSVSGVWAPPGRGSYRLSLRGQDREQGVPGIENFTPSPSATATDRNVNLVLSHRREDFGVFDAVETQIDLVDQRGGFRDLEGPVFLIDQTTQIRGGGFAAQGALRRGSHSVRLRFDGRFERAEVDDQALDIVDRGGAERVSWAWTVEDVVTRGRLTLAPALRVERREDRFLAGGQGTLPPPSGDVGETGVSGKFGLAWTLGPRTQLRGSVGRFFRAPNLTELFGNRGAIVGNPELRSESGWSGEFGVQRRFDGEGHRLSVELLGFHRDVDDLIWLLNNAQGIARFQNLGGARVSGLEASVDLRFEGGIALSAGGTLQRPEESSAIVFDGKPLVYEPERLGYLGLSWTQGRVDGRWDATYVGANSTDRADTPELRMSSRLLHDVRFGVRLRGGARLGLDIRNLFDRQVRDVARYPLPSRVVLLHVGWQRAAR